MLDEWGSPAPKRATQFGSLIHLLLENWYADSIGRPISCKAGAEELALTCFQRVAKTWEKLAMKEGDKVEDVQADLAMARAVFPAYVLNWLKDDQKRKWLEVEQGFDLILQGMRARERSTECLRPEINRPGSWRPKPPLRSATIP
jgi:hypothetical protein